uniref:Uncharacterized protein n=1 Tax=Cannabis sativa TaxID=3483 RepID=A0A803NID0_CANSA
MGVKSVANRSKEKRQVGEADDSDFAPPLLKRDRGPTKKKAKVNVPQKISPSSDNKNEQLKVKDIRPTDEERQNSNLDGLFLDEFIDDRG